ncbi:RmlC-like cupin [Auriculariales sp. MPI-PUGE-AT-0066]|nr:RmlC-like cupin [Auriculariales sp. MPI-PUGE-AT-0066]
MVSLRSLVVWATAVSAALAAPTKNTFMRRFVDDLSHQLMGEPTALGRFNLLKGDVNNFIFDFIAERRKTESDSDDGVVVLATAGNFPLAIGNGIAMGIGWMGPCGLNVPHWHPRASELLVAIGGSLQFGTFQEDNASFINGTIHDHQATIFPAGSLHYQQNLMCTSAQFIAAFSSDDPGRLDAAPSFFKQLPANINNAALGDIGVEEVLEIAHKIPNNVAWGVQQCLDRCRLSRPGQWTPEAVAKAKGELQAFLEQGPISPKDFAGLSVVPSI